MLRIHVYANFRAIGYVATRYAKKGLAAVLQDVDTCST